MQRLFRFLFRGCFRCEWETVEKINLVNGPKDLVPMGHRYILRCKKCGWIIRREFL